MKHFVLFYDFVPDFETHRAEHRERHLVHAEQSNARGDLVLAGALTEPLDGGLFLFRATSPAIAEEFAQGDPYVAAGLVSAWQVREWATAIGAGATSPVDSPEQADTAA